MSVSSSHIDKARSLCEIGRLNYEKGQFAEAEVYLSEASELFYQACMWSDFLDCMNMLLRLYVERVEVSKVVAIKEKIQTLVASKRSPLNSQTYYCLGLCAAYQSLLDEALEYLKKSLNLALADKDKKNICYALSGLVIVYTSMGQLDQAIKEIRSLEVMFQGVSLPDVETSIKVTHSYILVRQDKAHEALQLLEEAYEQIKESKNYYVYLTLLYAMGFVNAKLGNNSLAKVYLNLAKKSADPKNMTRIYDLICRKIDQLGGDESDFDLRFNMAEGELVERTKGQVNFKNQFVLLDMLKLFLDNPGEIFSKEDLVERVWKQEYDPRVHDNKIYVTIKRLRKMIEPEYEKPKYICRAKNGYYLNKETKVVFS